jgi:chromosome segregation ATPase
MENLGVLREKMVTTGRALEEKRVLLAGLTNRQDGIVKQLAEGKFFLETAMMEHQALLKRVPLNEVPQEDLFAKAKEIEELKLKIGELEALNSSFPAVRDNLQREITQLEKNLQGSIHDFWYQVCAIEKQASANNSLLRAWAAFNLSGGGGSFGQFLSLHFNSYFTADLARITNELRREYLGEGVK